MAVEAIGLEKRLGVGEYQQTASLWLRGTLEHDFNVSQYSVDWWMERSEELSHGGATGCLAWADADRELLCVIYTTRPMSKDGGRFLRWLTLPYRVGGRRGTRVLEFASRPFSQLADRILGSAFLEDIGEFFANFQTMYDGFVARAGAVERLLHDRRTTFAVVTTLEPAPLHEAERFCDALVERSLHLGALVCNRTLPDLLVDPAAAAAATTLRHESESIAADLVGVADAGLDDAARVARVLRIAGEAFDRFAVVARREAELRRELARVPEVVARVPALAGDIGDVAALAAIARHLYGEGEQTVGS